VTLDKWIVLVVGIAAIGWLNWNFIRRMRSRSAPPPNIPERRDEPPTPGNEESDDNDN
jgi:hypothetical protein